MSDMHIYAPGRSSVTAPGITVRVSPFGRMPETWHMLQLPTYAGGQVPQVVLGTARMSLMVHAITTCTDSSWPVLAEATVSGSPLKGAGLANIATPSLSMDW